ncbi:MAG: FeoA family protein [Pyrinomonadaceae bacterium]
MNSTSATLARAFDSEQTTLSKLPVGSLARVVFVKDVEHEGHITRRLMEMGLVPGAAVRVIKSAPLGCPIEIIIRGYHLALRVREADRIMVATIDA